MTRSIEAEDAQRVCFILLRLIERDEEPITITCEGKPMGILSPVKREQSIGDGESCPPHPNRPCMCQLRSPVRGSSPSPRR
jgi:hypothetical protein